MNNHEDWVRIYRSSELLQVKLAEDVLKQNGIESHILHRPDSAIPSIGEAELFTLPNKAQRAVEILRANGIT